MLLRFPVSASCYQHLTLSLPHAEQINNFETSHCSCPCVCVYIYVSEVPITVLVLKMEPENEYTTSSSSLKFEETMTMIDQVVQSQKTNNIQDTWKCPQIYLCKDRLLMATFYYCHFTAVTFHLRMVQHRQWIIYLTRKGCSQSWSVLEIRELRPSMR